MSNRPENIDEYGLPPKGFISHKEWEKQPPCPITEQVVKDLKTRSALGLMKYGVTLARKDLTLKEWLTHQYEELLDAAKYCKRAIVELEAREQSSPFNPLDHENMK